MDEQQNVNMGQTPSSNTTQNKSATWEQQGFQPSDIAIGQEVEYVPTEGTMAQEMTIAELCNRDTGIVNLRSKSGGQMVQQVRYSAKSQPNSWHFKGQSGSRPRGNMT